MSPLLIIVLLLFAVSGVGLIAFVLLHSGKGTGISDMIMSSADPARTSTGVVEKNLDRITIILAVIFFVCLIALMFVYPQGTIA